MVLGPPSAPPRLFGSGRGNFAWPRVGGNGPLQNWAFPPSKLRLTFFPGRGLALAPMPLTGRKMLFLLIGLTCPMGREFIYGLTLLSL